MKLQEKSVKTQLTRCRFFMHGVTTVARYLKAISNKAGEPCPKQQTTSSLSDLSVDFRLCVSWIIWRFGMANSESWRKEQDCTKYLLNNS